MLSGRCLCHNAPPHPCNFNHPQEETTVETVKIETQPAVLRVDFEQARQDIEAFVGQYRMTVTADNVADAKKRATELNGFIKDLDQRRKDAVAEVSQPIKTADQQMKELVEIGKQGRRDILEQVEVFENETRERVRELLSEYLQQEWDRLKVAPDYRRAATIDLVKLTSITGAGKLTASARQQVEARAARDRALQDQVERRLIELENASHRAGLPAPLRRDHVSDYLESDDSAFWAYVDRLIDAELQREAEATERRARMAQREAAAQPEEPADKGPGVMPAEPEAGGAPSEPAPDETPPAYEPPAGVRVIVATFEVPGAEGIPAEKLAEQLREKMAHAGFRHVTRVEVKN